MYAIPSIVSASLSLFIANFTDRNGYRTYILFLEGLIIMICMSVYIVGM